ncbi:MAG TPA: hypothetical protein VKM94_18575 [Blastocatellia bacterium]|nr:hypothetical protein [Blastocatellia bacterium]
MIKIACPDSCEYLRSARAESRDREAELRLKEARAGGKLDLGLSQLAMAAAYLTDRAIVDACRGLQGAAIEDLKDYEVLAAVENAIKNLDTQASGLIYEHREADGRVSDLSRRIRESLSKGFDNEAPDFRPKHSDIVRALKYVRDAVEAHMLRPGADPRSYIRYVSLFSPWPEQEPQQLII